MTERRYSSVMRRRIAAPVPLVWAVLADTNRWDRAAGMMPAKYALEPANEDEPGRVTRVGRSRELGFDLVWREPPYEWVESHYLRGERLFAAGPITRGGFSVRVKPNAGHTDVETEVWVVGDSTAAAIVGPLLRLRMRRALRRYLRAVADVLRDATIEGQDAELSAGTLAHRMLAAAGRNDVALGRTTPADETQLQHCAARLSSAPIGKDIRDRLIAYVRERPDEEIETVRAPALARAWGIDRREGLRAALHATRAGLFELQWRINCPSCRVATQTHGRMDALRFRGHCEVCDIGFDLDFADHVEAAFRVNPSIRAVDTSVYCASSPWYRPHVFAQLPLMHHDAREFDVALPRTLIVRRVATGDRHRISLDHAPAALQMQVTPQGLAISVSNESSHSGLTHVVARNLDSAAALILIERADEDTDRVLGTEIASMAEFADLFATEAPAAGVELSVRSLTVLFSDLTGSTELYERVGDARAFALVEEHFGLMGQAVAMNGGSIIKTMGDAVMAVFASPEHGLAAAIDMVRSTARTHASMGLLLKVGLHEGACLAVRANDRLDFFGTTVNMAARLQAQAKGSQVVIAAELCNHDGVNRIVQDSGHRTTVFDAYLKGISHAQKLMAIDVQTSADRTSGHDG